MATRFYLTDTAVAVSPSQAAWNDVDSAVRRLLVTTKAGFPASGGFITPAANTWTSGQTALAYQGVSDPMSSGLVFTSSTAKMQIQLGESALEDNVRERVRVWISSEDGNTERIVLYALAGYGDDDELTSGIRTNTTVLDGDITGATYTTVSGDRLIVEVGFTDVTGTTPSALIRYGSNSGSSDLLEDETETASLAAWFETSVNITFGGGGTPTVTRRSLLGVGV